MTGINWIEKCVCGSLGVVGFFFLKIEIESEIDIIVSDGYRWIFYYFGISIIRRSEKAWRVGREIKESAT